MFIISCKFNKKFPYIINLVNDIRKFHPDEKIVVVDSDSADKSYFGILSTQNIIIEDIANKNWMIGAYWHAFKKYPNEEFYFFFHDSMRVKNNLDYLKSNELMLLATFNRNTNSLFNKLNNRIKQETKVDPVFVKLEGRGCYGPIFMCQNKVMKALLELNVDKFLPINKEETQMLEGSFGLFFESLGYNLDNCNLYGDILELELPGGKSGPPPHYTEWQFPIEKFYASHKDSSRL